MDVGQGNGVDADQPPDAEDRIALLERQVSILFAMLYSQGRGLSFTMDTLGIDQYAACADVDDPHETEVRNWVVLREAERVLRDD